MQQPSPVALGRSRPAPARLTRDWPTRRRPSRRQRKRRSLSAVSMGQANRRVCLTWASTGCCITCAGCRSYGHSITRPSARWRPTTDALVATCSPRSKRISPPAPTSVKRRGGLNLHRNSLLYRVQRIEETGQVDLQEPRSAAGPTSGPESAAPPQRVAGKEGRGMRPAASRPRVLGALRGRCACTIMAGAMSPAKRALLEHVRAVLAEAQFDPQHAGDIFLRADTEAALQAALPTAMIAVAGRGRCPAAAGALLGRYLPARPLGEVGHGPRRRRADIAADRCRAARGGPGTRGGALPAASDGHGYS